MPRVLKFARIDVFSSTPLEGNPLAVITDARGLSDDEMLAIAREFNLGEATFVFPRDRTVEQARGIRTRIFNKEEEMPFAGHPTLGTAAVLRGLGAGDLVTLELNVGSIPVRFSSRSGQPYGEMTQADPTFGQVHDRARVAAALGVPVSELDASLPIQTVSTGNPVAIVPFAHLETLQRWVPRWDRMQDYLRGTDAKFFYAISRETVAPEVQVHARMVFYGVDDLATGSAAGPLAAWLVRNGRIPPGSPIQIEQGLEVRRPSRLFAQADRVGEDVSNVRVGGFFVPMLRGEMDLPGA